MRNRIVGILIGLGLAAGFLVWQNSLPVPPIWNLLSENEGPITSVALQYSRGSSGQALPSYRAFLTSIDRRTKVIAVCGSASDASEFLRIVRSWNLPGLDRVYTVVVGQSITTWCKDRFLVARSRKNALICPPPTEAGLAGRTHDALVAAAIARSYPSRFRRVQIPLYFDSGDILAGHQNLFVSDVLWHKNNNPKGLEEHLGRLFGRKVIRLRGVPNHHIGMFMAPLDDHTVMAGDPSLAQPLWNNRIDKALGPADFSASASVPFQRAIAELRRAGFRVIRVPLAVIDPQTFVTYTNAVFETRGSHKTVYMPWYDEPGLDEAARRAYESKGWEVRPIPVRGLYRNRGTIGCLINVLERG